MNPLFNDTLDSISIDNSHKIFYHSLTSSMLSLAAQAPRFQTPICANTSLHACMDPDCFFFFCVFIYLLTLNKYLKTK